MTLPGTRRQTQRLCRWADVYRAFIRLELAVKARLPLPPSPLFCGSFAMLLRPIQPVHVDLAAGLAVGLLLLVGLTPPHPS